MLTLLSPPGGPERQSPLLPHLDTWEASSPLPRTLASMPRGVGFYEGVQGSGNKAISWHAAGSKGEWGAELEPGRAEGHPRPKRQPWNQVANSMALMSPALPQASGVQTGRSPPAPVKKISTVTWTRHRRIERGGSRPAPALCPSAVASRRALRIFLCFLSFSVFPVCPGHGFVLSTQPGAGSMAGTRGCLPHSSMNISVCSLLKRDMQTAKKHWGKCELPAQ